MSEQNKEQTTPTITNYTFKLEEMLDAMSKSLDNINNVANEHKKLSAIIANSSEAETFKDFLNDSAKQIAELYEQAKTISFRKQLLQKVVDNCQQDDAIAEIISVLLEALGMFK